MAHVVFFSGLGMLAGALARWLLARLRRGAPVARPWCELVTGALWALSGYWWSTGRLGGQWLPLLLGMGWLAVAAGAVDLLRRRLPDALTLPALPGVLVLAGPLGLAAVGRAAGGAAVLAGGYLAVRLIAPAAVGAGDVKLAAPVGAALAVVSWPAVLVGALGASVLTLLMPAAVRAWSAVGSVLAGPVVGSTAGPVSGSTVGLGGVAALGAGGPGPPPGKDRGVPHGPALLAAGWLVLAAAGTGVGTGAALIGA
jgi:leader peptidase (prepilin peptidase)/N-methyltransferase